MPKKTRAALFRAKLSSSESLPVIAIAVIWIAMEVLIDPRGNFPLNDDWCYARAVLTLLQAHTLYLISVVTMTLVAQVLWGTLFCLLFGPSFTTLRLSTLTLGLVGLLVTYKLLRYVGASRSVAFIGCMVIAVNPLYFELSNTFMTDVPFFAFAILSVYFYMRAIRSGSTSEIVKGTLLACTAMLTRQLGVLLPLSFALAHVAKNGVRMRTVVKALLPVVVVFGTLIAYEIWLGVTGRTPLYYSLQGRAASSLFSNGLAGAVLDAANLIRTASVYVGLFLFPFLILVFPKTSEGISPRQRMLNSLVSAAFFVVLMGTLINEGQWMPLQKQPGNLLFDFGLGPTTLRDVWNLELPYLPTAPLIFWQIITVAGAAGAALLAWHLLPAIETLLSRKASGMPREDRPFLVLLLTASALCLAPIVPLVKYIYYDRYFLPLIPLLMAIVVITGGRYVRAGRVAMSAAAAVLVLYSIFSIGATHDYLTWNRVRWKAGFDLMREEGIPSNQIDGGDEFNGWLNYREELKQYWWQATTNDYMITFGPVPGYEEIKCYPFRRWMPYGEAEILVLKKFDDS